MTLTVSSITRTSGRADARLVLPFDLRQRSRLLATLDSGEEIGLTLPRGTVLRGGDRLQASDGRVVEVVAAPEQVSIVRTGDARQLARAAYHLGNRHVALDLQPDRLQIEPDPVLAGMLRQMHLTVTEELAPFEPEGGAYASHGAHEHHAPAHEAPVHVHGPGCQHDH